LYSTRHETILPSHGLNRVTSLESRKIRHRMCSRYTGFRRSVSGFSRLAQVAGWLLGPWPVFTNPVLHPGLQQNRLPVKDNRPVNLDLTKFHFPLPAITSILHRISGVLLFAATAVLLWLLAESLSSEQGFERVRQWLDMMAVKLLLWVVLTGLLYHLIAGIRHLLMDIGVGETLQGGRTGAVLVIVFSVTSMVLAGVWLW